VRFSYLTGWRWQSEAVQLHWAQVDFVSGFVRVEPYTTKNDEGREFLADGDKPTGHKTEAIFRRSAIPSTSDLRDAGAKLAALGDNSGPLELQDPGRRRGSTRKVVGRDGIEPPTPGCSEQSGER
jgi:hypothetical protein